MFGEFLNIIFRSIKLDKSLYKENRYFGEAGSHGFKSGPLLLIIEIRVEAETSSLQVCVFLGLRPGMRNLPTFRKISKSLKKRSRDLSANLCNFGTIAILANR